MKHKVPGQYSFDSIYIFFVLLGKTLKLKHQCNKRRPMKLLSHFTYRNVGSWDRREIVLSQRIWRIICAFSDMTKFTWVVTPLDVNKVNNSFARKYTVQLKMSTANNSITVLLCRHCGIAKYVMCAFPHLVFNTSPVVFHSRKHIICNFTGDWYYSSNLNLPYCINLMTIDLN